MKTKNVEFGLKRISVLSNIPPKLCKGSKLLHLSDLSVILKEIFKQYKMEELVLFGY